MVARHQLEHIVDAVGAQVSDNLLRVGLHRLECLNLGLGLLVAEQEIRPALLSPNDLPLYNTWKYLYKVVVLSNKSLHIIDKYSHNL